MTKPTKPAVKKPSGKVFDVRRPGKAPAPSTSRPVIVGHKPEVQDSVVGVSGIGDSARQPLLTAKKRVIGIQPIDAAAEPSASEQPKIEPELTGVPSSVPPLPADSASESDAVPVTVAKKPLKLPPSEPVEEASVPVAVASMPDPAQQEPEPQPVAPVVSEEPAVTSVPAVAETKPAPVPDLVPPPPPVAKTSEAPAPQAKPEPKPADSSTPPAGATESEPWLALTDAAQSSTPQETPLSSEPEFNIQPIVVSHHHSSSHIWKVILLLILIVVLAAVAVNILLDAQIITVPGVPHTNFLQP